MIVPLVVYFLGLITVAFIKLLLNSAVNPFFALPMAEGVEVAFLDTMWNYVLMAYFVVGVILVFILAQKRGGRVF